MNDPIIKKGMMVESKVFPGNMVRVYTTDVKQLYFCQEMDEMENIKIGSGNTAERKEKIDGLNSREIKILCAVNLNEYDWSRTDKPLQEQILHWFFEPFQVKKEWFKKNSVLNALIKSLNYVRENYSDHFHCSLYEILFCLSSIMSERCIDHNFESEARTFIKMLELLEWRDENMLTAGIGKYFKPQMKLFSTEYNPPYLYYGAKFLYDKPVGYIFREKTGHYDSFYGDSFLTLKRLSGEDFRPIVTSWWSKLDDKDETKALCKNIAYLKNAFDYLRKFKSNTAWADVMERTILTDEEVRERKLKEPKLKHPIRDKLLLS